MPVPSPGVKPERPYSIITLSTLCHERHVTVPVTEADASPMAQSVTDRSSMYMVPLPEGVCRVI